MSAKMAALPQAIDLLTAVFDKYAGQDKDKTTLTKKELSDLLKNEFPGATSCKAETDKFFNTLDGDRDGVVTFHEYISFVAALAEICKE